LALAALRFAKAAVSMIGTFERGLLGPQLGAKPLTAVLRTEYGEFGSKPMNLDGSTLVTVHGWRAARRRERRPLAGYSRSNLLPLVT
jgi:hypothetical protein